MLKLERFIKKIEIKKNKNQKGGLEDKGRMIEFLEMQVLAIIKVQLEMEPYLVWQIQ